MISIKISTADPDFQQKKKTLDQQLAAARAAKQNCQIAVQIEHDLLSCHEETIYIYNI